MISLFSNRWLYRCERRRQLQSCANFWRQILLMLIICWSFCTTLNVRKINQNFSLHPQLLIIIFHQIIQIVWQCHVY